MRGNPRVILWVQSVGMKDAENKRRITVWLAGDREIDAARLPPPDASDDLAQVSHHGFTTLMVTEPSTSTVSRGRP